MKKRNMMMVLLIAITLMMVVVNLHHLRSALAGKRSAKENTFHSNVCLDLQTAPVPGIFIRIY